ncbi:hypothetical protein JT05_02405 [Desulfosporosinus sp. Tol-M]|nr:hypothetical protein JT05_02405 [Desulfosporosinus sp. Tol-M]
MILCFKVVDWELFRKLLIVKVRANYNENKNFMEVKMENVQLVTENATEQPIPFNAIIDGPHDERLSASEIGSLWETYLYNATSKCQLQYFVTKAQDPKIRAALIKPLFLVAHPNLTLEGTDK